MPCNHLGLLIDHNTEEPYPMAAVETSASWIQSFQVALGTVSCSRRMTLTDSREKVSVSPLREEKPQHTISREDKQKSPCTKMNAPSSSHKEEESHKTSGRNSGALSPWAPDSTSSKKSSHWGKHSSPAKEQPDICDTRDHCSSSKHKDRSCHDKSSRCCSDKESSSTPCKCALSSPPCPGSAE